MDNSNPFAAPYESIQSAPTTQSTQSDNPYMQDFQSASDKYGVPTSILMGVAQTESSMNPNAKAKTSHAEGLMQLIPKFYPNVDPLDPSQAIPAAAQTLAQNYKHFGNWHDAIQAYHDGVTGWERIKSGKAQQSEESKNYTPKVLAASKDFIQQQNPFAAPYESQPAPQESQTPQEKDGSFWSNFWTNYKNPVSAFQEDSLPAQIGRGVLRFVSDVPQTVDYVKKVGPLDWALSALKDDWHSVKEYFYPQDTKNQIDFGQLKKDIVANPGKFAAIMANTMEDPTTWMIPFGFGGKLADAAGTAAKAMGKTAVRLAKGTGRAAESAAVGGAYAGTYSAAQQYSQTGKVDINQLVNQTDFGAAAGAVLGGLIGLKAPKEAGGMTHNDQLDYLNMKTDAAKAKAPEERNLEDLLHLNNSDAYVSAQQTAYDLMQTGASKKNVEAIRKRNPLVGKVLDEMMARRQDTIGAMKDTVQGEVLGPEVGFVKPPRLEGSVAAEFDPTTDISLYRWTKIPDAEVLPPPKPYIEGQQKLGYDLPPNQRGFAQSDVLKWLGFPAAGALIGASLDPQHPTGGAILGGIGGALLT